MSSHSEPVLFAPSFRNHAGTASTALTNDKGRGTETPVVIDVSGRSTFARPRQSGFDASVQPLIQSASGRGVTATQSAAVVRKRPPPQLQPQSQSQPQPQPQPQPHQPSPRTAVMANAPLPSSYTPVCESICHSAASAGGAAGTRSADASASASASSLSLSTSKAPSPLCLPEPALQPLSSASASPTFAEAVVATTVPLPRHLQPYGRTSYSGKMLMIGCGSIGQALLPLLFRHFTVTPDRVLVITGDDRGRDVARILGVSFTVAPLTRGNYRAVLDTAALSRGDFVINVSVDVSSVALMEMCAQLGVLYIDTCTEPWPGVYDEPGRPLAARTNYALREEVLALRRQLQRCPPPGGVPAIVTVHGANPGLVSHFVKRALEVLAGAEDAGGAGTSTSASASASSGGVSSVCSGAGPSCGAGAGADDDDHVTHVDDGNGVITQVLTTTAKVESTQTGKQHFPGGPRTRSEWAMLAHDLGVQVIHIAERDTQGSKVLKAPGEFVNTWSVDGFISEAVQPAELGWGTHERALPHDGRVHDGGCRAAIYLSRPGCTTRVRSWTPVCGAYHGFLITHDEAISIADYFTVTAVARDAGAARVLYRPTVHYAYHPCNDAVLSLHELVGRTGSQLAAPSKARILRDDIEAGGVDELGVLLGRGRGLPTFWYGSTLSIEDARRLGGPTNTATSLQVVAAMLGAMTWAVHNPAAGVVTPDEVDHRTVLAVAEPYLGTLSGVCTSWTPLSGRLGSVLFPEPDLDVASPWQFANVRVQS